MQWYNCLSTRGWAVLALCSIALIAIVIAVSVCKSFSISMVSCLTKCARSEERRGFSAERSARTVCACVYLCFSLFFRLYFKCIVSCRARALQRRFPLIDGHNDLVRTVSVRCVCVVCTLLYAHSLFDVRSLMPIALKPTTRYIFCRVFVSHFLSLFFSDLAI